MNKNSIEDFKKKLTQLNYDTSVYLNEIKELVSKTKQKEDIKVISYFTYSLSLSHEKEQENLIIGTYHIQNIGNKSITDPYICIKLLPDSPFIFSGKYLTKKPNGPIKIPDAWERLNDQTDKYEYWLKPIDNQRIDPSQTITFQNFQVKWFAQESYSGSVMGFTYSDQFQNGIPAINQINVSGQ